MDDILISDLVKLLKLYNEKNQDDGYQYLRIWDDGEITLVSACGDSTTVHFPNLESATDYLVDQALTDEERALLNEALELLGHLKEAARIIGDDDGADELNAKYNALARFREPFTQQVKDEYDEVPF